MLKPNITFAAFWLFRKFLTLYKNLVKDALKIKNLYD